MFIEEKLYNILRKSKPHFMKKLIFQNYKINILKENKIVEKNSKNPYQLVKMKLKNLLKNEIKQKNKIFYLKI